MGGRIDIDMRRKCAIVYLVKWIERDSHKSFMLSSGWYGQAKLTPFEPKKEFLVVRMAASLLLLDCNNNNNNINWRYSRLGCFIYFSCCLFSFFFWSFSCSLRPRCRYRRRSSSSICFTRNRWFVFIFYSYSFPFPHKITTVTRNGVSLFDHVETWPTIQHIPGDVRHDFDLDYIVCIVEVNFCIT